MKKADILFKNAAIIIDGGNFIKNGCLAVAGGKIAGVGEKLPEIEAERVVDASDKLLMPGLINAHMHVPMTLLRGYADDYDLQTWLNDYIFPAEARLDARCVRAGALMGIAEMLASGTTSFSDMYYFCNDIAECVEESGIKANLSRGQTFFGGNFDFDMDEASREMRDCVGRWNGFDSGRIRFEASIHAEYTSAPPLWKALAAYAKEAGIGINLHLSETRREHEDCIRKYGMTPAALFERAGVFGSRVTAAHCVWVSDEDVKILASHGASVAHNPVSNLKLGSGVANIAGFAKEGVNVALGTDGVSSNNSADMFETLKLAAILHKGINLDPGLMTAGMALGMATVGGAKAQGREEECGRLIPGMDADIIMLDLDRPGLMPCHNPVSAAVYSAKGSDVCMTMVRGKILCENGEQKTIDLEKVKYELKNYALPHIFG